MKPCPLTGAGHYWRLTPYERYISRGECSCGAVRFMHDTFGGDPKFRQQMDTRLKQLNKLYGKEGTMAETAENPTDNTTDTRVHIEGEGPEQAEPTATRKERLDEARKLRGKKCQSCEHSYAHDEIRWCSLKKCPSRLPEKNRLQYRPLLAGEGTPAQVKAFQEEAKAPAGSPSATKVDKIEPSATKADKGEHAASADIKVTIIRLPASSGLPQLPEFNPKWKKDVQLKWMDTFRELAGGKK